jgi:hypothetical protein
MNEFSAAVLQIECPKCRRGPSHWCRDEKGKCVSSHRERRQAALKAVLAPYAYFVQRPKAGALMVVCCIALVLSGCSSATSPQRPRILPPRPIPRIVVNLQPSVPAGIPAIRKGGHR